MFKKTAPARFPIPKIFILVFYTILAATIGWAGSTPPTPIKSIEDNTREDETQTSKIIQAFLLQGKMLSDQSDPNGAIDNFGRVLLLDPWNQSALEKLIFMSEREHLPAAKKAQIFRVEAIRKFMENLKSKIDYFAARRDGLKDQLIQGGHTQSFLEHNMADVKNRFWSPRENMPDDHASQDPLSAVVISLNIEKEWLASELKYIQKQYEWLRTLNSQTRKGSFPVIPSQDIIQETSRISEWTMENRKPRIAVESIPAKETTISKEPDAGEKQDQDIILLQQELGEVTKKLDDLQEHIREKDQKLVDLSKQIIGFSLKLAENEMILTEKVNALTSLTREYADLRSRLELGQKIIQEKDSHLQSLEESLSALQSETAVHEKESNGILALRDASLTELEGILRIYQERLSDTTRKVHQKDFDLSGIQEQLDSARMELFEKETALHKTKQQLTALREELRHAQKRLLQSQFPPRDWHREIRSIDPMDMGQLLGNHAR